MSNPRLKLRTTSDGLSAFLAVAAGSALEASELSAELQARGIISGIIAETYERLAMGLLEPTFQCDEELLAVGYDAHPGTDAWFESAFTAGLQAGHLREDGSIDYHDRELLKPVTSGDVLGIVHPALSGVAGQRVDGSPIAVSPPRPLSLQLLSGVTVCDDLLIRATRAGVILYVAGQYLDVVNRHLHQGHVDMHSGNLNMQGSLVVKGDVLHSFSVSATGDIEILGNVDGATVQAGGNLRIRGGVRGSEGGAVCAEGDLTLHHAEAAELHAGGAIRLQESVNSRLEAVEIHSGGRIRGGSALSERRIIIKEAGAINGIDTRLTAGEPLESPLAAAQRCITTAKAQRLSERVRGRSNDRNKSGKAGRAKAELGAAEVQRLAERAKRRESLLESASIQVTLAHPGVSIRIGNAQLTIDSAVRATRYSLDRETAVLRVEKTSA